MKNSRHNQNQTITLAQLCEALANGHITAELEDGMYVIKGNDLRRFARASMPELALTSQLSRAYSRKAG